MSQPPLDVSEPPLDVSDRLRVATPSYRAELSESPVYSNGLLSWVCITSSHVATLDTTTGAVTTWRLPNWRVAPPHCSIPSPDTCVREPPPPYLAGSAASCLAPPAASSRRSPPHPTARAARCSPSRCLPALQTPPAPASAMCSRPARRVSASTTVRVAKRCFCDTCHDRVARAPLPQASATRPAACGWARRRWTAAGAASRPGACSACSTAAAVAGTRPRCAR